MEALESQPEAADPSQVLGYLLGVDTELLGAATHLHARAFQLEIRIDPQSHTRGQPQLLRGCCQHRQLAR